MKKTRLRYLVLLPIPFLLVGLFFFFNAKTSSDLDFDIDSSPAEFYENFDAHSKLYESKRGIEAVSVNDHEDWVADTPGGDLESEEYKVSDTLVNPDGSGYSIKTVSDNAGDTMRTWLTCVTAVQCYVSTDYYGDLWKATTETLPAQSSLPTPQDFLGSLLPESILLSDLTVKRQNVDYLGEKTFEITLSEEKDRIIVRFYDDGGLSIKAQPFDDSGRRRILSFRYFPPEPVSLPRTYHNLEGNIPEPLPSPEGDYIPSDGFVGSLNGTVQEGNSTK